MEGGLTPQDSLWCCQIVVLLTVPSWSNCGFPERSPNLVRQVRVFFQLWFHPWLENYKIMICFSFEENTLIRRAGLLIVFWGKHFTHKRKLCSVSFELYRERWQNVSTLQILEQLEQTGANGLRGWKWLSHFTPWTIKSQSTLKLDP